MASTKTKLFHLFVLFVLSRQRNLKSEAIRIAIFNGQIFIQSKLYMWQISHIQDICYLIHLFFRCLLKQQLILPQNQYIQKRVHMGSWGKVQTGSYVSPIIDLGIVSVFPKKILWRFLSPEHQIYLHLFDQWQANILCDSQSLLIIYAVFIYYYKMS